MFRIAATLILTLVLAGPAHAELEERESTKARSGQRTAQDRFSAGWAANQRGDYATALREWRPLAEQGVAGAHYNLGVLYAKGRGVPQNDVEAVRWYRLAAEQGYASAQYNVGLRYATGRGVPENDVEAMKWYRLAAEQGHPAACTALKR